MREEYGSKYATHSLRDIHALKKLCPFTDDKKDVEACEMNLLMAATSGTHGSYTTLDDFHEDNDHDYEDIEDVETIPNLTVLVIHPRRVAMYYGSVDVPPEEEWWVRLWVKRSVEAFARAAEGSLPKEDLNMI